MRRARCLWVLQIKSAAGLAENEQCSRWLIQEMKGNELIRLNNTVCNLWAWCKVSSIFSSQKAQAQVSSQVMGIKVQVKLQVWFCQVDSKLIKFVSRVRLQTSEL